MPHKVPCPSLFFSLPLLHDFFFLFCRFFFEIFLPWFVVVANKSKWRQRRTGATVCFAQEPNPAFSRFCFVSVFPSVPAMIMMRMIMLVRVRKAENPHAFSLLAFWQHTFPDSRCFASRQSRRLPEEVLVALKSHRVPPTAQSQSPQISKRPGRPGGDTKALAGRRSARALPRHVLAASLCDATKHAQVVPLKNDQKMCAMPVTPWNCCACRNETKRLSMGSTQKIKGSVDDDGCKRKEKRKQNDKPGETKFHPLTPPELHPENETSPMGGIML